MKKVLFMLLCCTVFFIGCNKAPQEQADENIDTTATVTGEQSTNQAEIDDAKVNALGQTAREKIDKGDYKGAIADLTEASTLKDFSWIYAQRAKAKELDGNLKDALVDATKAVELTPDQGWMYGVRADIKDAMGDEKGAAQDREKAKQYGN